MPFQINLKNNNDKKLLFVEPQDLVKKIKELDILKEEYNVFEVNIDLKTYLAIEEDKIELKIYIEKELDIENKNNIKVVYFSNSLNTDKNQKNIAIFVDRKKKIFPKQLIKEYINEIKEIDYFDNISCSSYNEYVGRKGKTIFEKTYLKFSLDKDKNWIKSQSKKRRII
jgi:hypothetical protein